MKKRTIALAGNPNVGKSTVFNSLTGMNQHTGNWPGKTVSGARGSFTYKDTVFTLVDLPGTYSLSAASVDEAVAGDYICSGEADITLIVADATCLERNLNLVLQILSITKKAILCVNLLDEAQKKKISIDLEKLSELLEIPVVGMAARSGTGLDTLLETLWSFTQEAECKDSHTVKADYDPGAWQEFLPRANEVYCACVTKGTDEPHAFDRRLDRIVTSRIFGFPIMLLLLVLIFWITIAGANYPSQWLSCCFSSFRCSRFFDWDLHGWGLHNTYMGNFCHAPANGYFFPALYAFRGFRLSSPCGL